MMQPNHNDSLGIKRSRTKSFFRILAARKLERETKSQHLVLRSNLHAVRMRKNSSYKYSCYAGYTRMMTAES